MPFAQRDENGRIMALFERPTENADEQVSSTDPDVEAFLRNAASHPPQQLLETTDREIVRVLEDLIEVLVDKNVLMFTELPLAAQDKLIRRRRARDQLGNDGNVMVGEDDII